MNASLIAAITATFVLCISALGQQAFDEKTIFGDIGGLRGSSWYEDVSNNVLYHNDGGGTRRFVLNGNAAGIGGSSYLTVIGNVSSGFVNATVMSPYSTATPGFVYRAGSTNSAQHFYSPSTSSWHLVIDGTNSLRVNADRDLIVPNGGVLAEFIHAEAYFLDQPREESIWVTDLSLRGGDGANSLLYEIRLPHGAEVTRIDLRCVDNIFIDLAAGLYFMSFAEPPASSDGQINYSNLVTGVTSSGSSSAVRNFASTSVTNGVINNSERSYFIRLFANDGLAIGSRFSFRGIRVTYTTSKL